MKRPTTLERMLVVVSSLLILLSCGLPGAPAPDAGIGETQIAMGVQQTLISMRETELAAAPSDAPVEQAAAVETEPPTKTARPPEPTWTAIPTETATPEPSAPVLSMEERIRAANILVYEDIRGYYDLTPWVHSAITGMNFSGGEILEVGDAAGNFMKALNSPTRWDLIIVAAEIRQGVRGEFWDVIQDRVNDGAALIVEIWYLDETANGRIGPLLSKCGIAFQKDWWREPDSYAELDYSLYWLDAEHELFSAPNVVEPLYTPNIYWLDDVGDLIRLSAGGNATLLSGLYPYEKSRYGVLATCLDGRVIFQTFSSHDYRRSQVIPLWQNYITYTLSNHFEAQP